MTVYTAFAIPAHQGSLRTGSFVISVRTCSTVMIRRARLVAPGSRMAGRAIALSACCFGFFSPVLD